MVVATPLAAATPHSDRDRMGSCSFSDFMCCGDSTGSNSRQTLWAPTTAYGLRRYHAFRRAHPLRRLHRLMGLGRGDILRAAPLGAAATSCAVATPPAAVCCGAAEGLVGDARARAQPSLTDLIMSAHFLCALGSMEPRRCVVRSGRPASTVASEKSHVLRHGCHQQSCMQSTQRQTWPRWGGAESIPTWAVKLFPQGYSPHNECKNDLGDQSCQDDDVFSKREAHFGIASLMASLSLPRGCR